MIRHTSASPRGSKRIKRIMDVPKKNSLKGATFKPDSVITPIFIIIPVSHRKISFKKVIKTAPYMEPEILPNPPMITIAMYSTERPRVNGSDVILTI
jgi:hypothetical protein